MQQDTGRQFTYLRMVYLRRLPLFIFVALATVSAAIFSGPRFIAPVYRSEAIIYPPGTNSNRMLIDRDARFGSDKEIDELIQVLRSNNIRDSLLVKYSLYRHYGIDSTAPDKRYRLNKEFADKVSIDRTRFNSISVSVSDHDPVIAAGMANDIVALGDRFRAYIIKSKLKEAFTSLSESMFDISLEIDQLADEINSSFGKEVVSGSSFYKSNSIDQIREQLDLKNLMHDAREKNRPRELERLYFYEAKLQQFSTLQISYDQALVSINNDVPTSYVISAAEVADKKYFPIRWMFVVAAFAGSLVAGCVTIILFAGYKSMLAAIREKT
jgi:hypothetical protein